jgi:hypothetical protein
MKVYQGPEETSVLEFHRSYGSFIDFNQWTKTFRAELEEIEAVLHGEKEAKKKDEGEDEFED